MCCGRAALADVAIIGIRMEAAASERTTVDMVLLRVLPRYCQQAKDDEMVRRVTATA